MRLQRIGFGIVVALLLPFGTVQSASLAVAQDEAGIADDEANETDSARVRAEVAEAMDAIRKYSLQKRDEALTEAGEALDSLDSAIEKRERSLRENWSTMSDKAREEAEDALVELRARRGTLGEWYGAMRHGAGDAWDEIKGGFAAAYDDFLSAWQDEEIEETQDSTN